MRVSAVGLTWTHGQQWLCLCTRAILPGVLCPAPSALIPSTRTCPPASTCASRSHGLLGPALSLARTALQQASAGGSPGPVGGLQAVALSDSVYSSILSNFK